MPSTLEALIIIAVITSPGYITLQLIGRFSPVRRETNDLRILLPSISAGIFIHLLASFWSLRLLAIYQRPAPNGGVEAMRDNGWELMGWGFSVLIALPVGLGLLGGFVQNARRVDQALDHIGAGYVDRIPTAWEYVYRLDRAGFVKIHLADGGVVGGRYSSSSFAGDDMQDERPADLYIEDQWFLTPEGAFDASIPHNWGIWVAAGQIVRIEYFDEEPDSPAQEEINDDPDTITAGSSEPAEAPVGQQQARAPAQDNSWIQRASRHRETRSRTDGVDAEIGTRSGTRKWVRQFDPRIGR